MYTNQETYELFLMTPLNFEKVAYAELTQKLVLLDIKSEVSNISTTFGGVQLETNLESAHLLCQFLKIPTRILLRITKYKATDGPSLYNKTLKIKWNHYLRGELPKLHISTKQSRLFDSRKISKAVNDAISKYFSIHPCKEKYKKDPADAQVFIRIIEDLVTISIALDGKRLDQRGIKLEVNCAPIRENLAAGLLYITKKSFPTVDALIDPMCGSGTFALENATFYKNALREFYISKLPLFLKLPQKKLPTIDKNLFNHFDLFDNDQESLDYAKKNIERLEMDNAYQLEYSDIFSSDYALKKNSGVIVNPPYGLRIKIDQPLNDYYEKLIQSIFTKLAVQFIGMIIPAAIKLKEDQYTVKECFSFSNGGIKVHFLLLYKPEF